MRSYVNVAHFFAVNFPSVIRAMLKALTGGKQMDLFPGAAGEPGASACRLWAGGN